jgi:6-phosphogluconolactonase (cycloisomerase 2 family)
MVLAGCEDGSGNRGDDTRASDARPPIAARNIVYTSSNAADANSVLAFKSDTQGHLVAQGEYMTGGQGAGSGLANQGALATDGEFIVVVNAGSDDISSLRIEPDGLRQVDRISSGGIRPVSVALHRGLVYVVNAGSDNIAGFRLDASGRLSALDGSLRGLTMPSGTSPAQISFAVEGSALVVTERSTSMIVVFSLSSEGAPLGMHAITSATRTPFGFVASGRNLIVSEEDRGTSNASATSSYRLDSEGTLRVVTPSVVSMQTAACWVAMTPDGAFAFVANTGSDTISTYGVDNDARLSLIAPVSAMTPKPIDIEVRRDGAFLFALNAGAGTITSFRIDGNGALAEVHSVDGVPTRATGLIVF